MAIKEIKEAPGYFVDENGNVYSTKKRGVSWFKMKPHDSTTGYDTYTLVTEDGRYRTDAHRLVANAFIPNPENKRCVNHKDGDKTNNHVSNLEWVTYKENYEHAVINGLTVNPNGVTNHSNVYTESMIRKVCELLEEDNLSLLEIENITGVSFKTISQIRTGRSWTCISKDYKLKRKNNNRLSDEDVIEICNQINQGLDFKTISKNFNEYPVKYIKDISKKRRYKSIANQCLH